MKKIITLVLSVLMAVSSFAQYCYSGANGITPGSYSNPGFQPTSDLLPCISQGVYVSDTIYYTNFYSFSGLVVDSLHFDSIGNLPAGLCWKSNKVSNTFMTGENGVIQISGTSSAPAGQYNIKIFITAYVAGGIVVGPEADMNTLAGIYYWLRVSCSNHSCPSLDTINGKTNLFLADTSCSSSPYVTVSANGSTTFCAGGQVLLTANTNITSPTYRWSNGDVTQMIIANTTGNYSVTVYGTTDSAVSQSVAVIANSCNNPGGPGLYPSSEALSCITQGAYVHDTITFINFSQISGVNVDSLIIDSLGNLPAGLVWSTNLPHNTFYGGDTGLIFISGYTSAPAGQYSLQMFVQGGLAGGIVLPLNTNLTQLAGLYYWLRMACGNNNCMALDTIGGKTTSFIPDSSCSSSPYVIISGPTSFCTGGGSATLTASTNLSGCTYLWSNGPTTQSITVTTAGPYAVTVFNATDTVVSLLVTVFADSCYSGIGGPGFYPSSLTLPCITAGAYVHDTITFVNFTTINGITEDSLTFDSIQLPAGLSWSTNKPHNIWQSGDTGLIFISGYTSAAAGQYSMATYVSMGLTGGIVVGPNVSLNSLAGLYYWLRVACSNTNCVPVDTNLGKTTPFIADSSCSSAFAVSISGPNALCDGGSVTLTANSISNVSTYAWSDGETTQSVTVSPSTSSTYTVTATGSNGATAVSSIYITVYPAPVAMFSLTPDSTPHVWNILNQCSGDSLTYTWTWGDGNTTTTTNPALSHTYDSASYYTICVSVTEPIGCSASYCDSGVYLFKDQSGGVIQLNVSPYPAGITTVSESTQQISYYGGAVHFSEALTAPASIRLYDMSGREVLSQDGFTGNVMPVSNTFSQGVYIIHLQNSNYSISRKLPVLQ